VTTGTAALSGTLEALPAGAGSPEREYWRSLAQQKLEELAKYDQMFQHYRSQSAGLSEMRFAPFHLLAVEGRTWFHRSHLWHVQILNRIARTGNGFVVPTRYELVTTSERESWSKMLVWWDELSKDSEEGLVIKPLPFVPKGRRGFAQPALKCRSREHLRLVYGPEYDSPASREIMASRDALKNRRQKHRRIRQQFALSMEALTRFVQRSPLNAVHQCVLGVLALEVAPTDHH
jgi:protein phosphatase